MRFSHFIKTTRPSKTMTYLNFVWQSLVAIGEVTRQVLKADPNFPAINPLDYTRYMLISIGTGTEKQTPKFNAKEAAKWGVLGWLVNQGSAPLIEAFTQASADLVVMHNNVVFEALNSVNNYLRIQVLYIIHLIRV